MRGCSAATCEDRGTRSSSWADAIRTGEAGKQTVISGGPTGRIKRKSALTFKSLGTNTRTEGRGGAGRGAKSIKPAATAAWRPDGARCVGHAATEQRPPSSWPPRAAVAPRRPAPLRAPPSPASPRAPAGGGGEERRRAALPRHSEGARSAVRRGASRCGEVFPSSRAEPSIPNGTNPTPTRSHPTPECSWSAAAPRRAALHRAM